MDIDVNTLLNFLGTAIGTFGGIMASYKLMVYRIDQLEKKVDKHNNAVERLFVVESKVDTHEEKIEWLKDNTVQKNIVETP